jgi:ABC-2 type transport system permease protein
LGKNTGWGQYEFFLFYGTGLLVNSVVQTFFMVNADELSELVRTGTLDFALLKPIDTQFLVSLQRVDWSSLGNFALGLLLMAYSLFQLHYLPGPMQAVLYVVYVLCGVAIYYSLMISMAASSVWLGRNTTLFDFWFYLTNFSRYPMEIYQGPIGTPLRRGFTFLIPVLLVINVPARQLVPAFVPQFWEDRIIPAFALFAAVGSLTASRWIFTRALASYRSASS